MDQSPGERPNTIKQLQNTIGTLLLNRTRGDEQAQEHVDLFCGALSDAPMVQPIPTESAVSLSQVGWY
jgi:hypothetical protein